MKNKIKILIILSLLFFSCKEDRILSKKEIDNYNSQIQNGETNNSSWVKSPLSIALYLSKAGEVSQKANIKFEKINKGELAKDVIVKIHEEGVLDDSNSEANFYLHLKRVDGKWRVFE